MGTPLLQFMHLVKSLRLDFIWDFEDGVYETEKVIDFLAVASHGQCIILRFCLMVWRGDNHFNFDLCDAVKTLDAEYTRIIMDWIKQPFWP